MLICAATKSIPRGFNKHYIHGWDDSCNHLLREHQQATTKEEIDTTATALLQKLDEVRLARWTEVVESVDFTHSSRKAWQTINKLTGRSTTHSRCPVTANAIASQRLLNNGRFQDADRDFARWTSREITSLSRAATADANLSSDFTVEELEAAIKKLKSGKSPGRDNIHPEFVIHQSAKTTAWLCSFFTSCYRRSKLPKTWRHATVVALPKPNKPAQDPKSYRPISLLCIPFKILERLTHSRIDPVVDPRFPPWQINGGPSSTTNTRHRRQLSAQ